MSVNFQIEVKKKSGNLHVSPKGDLDGSSAWELINLLHERYNGRGSVVIDTHYLREICPFGCSTFRCGLNQSMLPPNRLSFEGEKGYEIAPEGCKVFVSQAKGRGQCNGDCTNCPCSENKMRVI